MSQTNEIVSFSGNELKIKIKGIPEKGKVNQALIKFLASVFNIPQSSFCISSGATSRNKRLKIEGLSEDDFDAQLKKELFKKPKQNPP